MREVDGLRALQVGVARHRPVEVALGQVGERAHQVVRAAPGARGVARARTAPCRSRPGRCASARCGACRRPGPTISVRRRSIAMWTSSSSGRTSKRSLLDLGATSSKPALERRRPRRRGSRSREHRDVRLRLLDVVGREPAVERDRRVQRLEDGSGGSRKRPIGRQSRTAAGASRTMLDAARCPSR